MLREWWEFIEIPVTRILVIIACLAVWYFIWHFGWYAINQYNETKRIEEELNNVESRVQYLEKMQVEDDGSVIITWEEDE